MAASMEPREFYFPDAAGKLECENACLSVIERDVPIALPPKYMGNEDEFVKLVLNRGMGKFDHR